MAEPLSRTGYDAVVVRGVSANPVYLEVSSGGVEFHDAGHLWGKETYETEDAIRREVDRMLSDYYRLREWAQSG